MFVQPVSIHSQIHLHFAYMQNLFPIGPAFWPHFPVFWIVDPIKPSKMSPWGIVGRIVFSYCPFPDESTDVYQIWCQSVQPFDCFPRLLNLWPPNPPPANAPWGDLYLYAHSQMNPPTWTKVGANRSSHLTASPDFWMFDPLKPPKCPIFSFGTICLAYIHSQMNLHMCTNRISRLTSSPDFWICDPLSQPSTLSSWSHWPRGPVDLKSHWPPQKSTGPQFFQTT